MARQSGILRLSGTLGGFTFYKLNGQYYVRNKSSLDRKRVLNDPAFARSRECSRRFGQASRIAKQVYGHLESHKKRRFTIGWLTAAAGRLLREGHTIAETGSLLANRCLGPSATALLAKAIAGTTVTFPAAIFLPYSAQPVSSALVLRGYGAVAANTYG